MKNPKILAVDDEEDILFFFEKYFSKRGYEISTAIDGYAALDKIKKDDFDMVITNINMDGIDGFQMLKEINKLDKNIIKIIASGVDSPEALEESRKLGCFAYIHKPLVLSELGTTIKDAFAAQRK